MSERPTDAEIQRVREWDCIMGGHAWRVIQTLAHGPVKVICDNCGADSGLVQFKGINVDLGVNR